MSIRYNSQPLTTWNGFLNAEGAAAEATATIGSVVNAGSTTALSYTLATGGQNMLYLAGSASNTSGTTRAAHLVMEGTGISGSVTGLTVDANGGAATTGTTQLLGADINCYLASGKYVASYACALQTWIGGESDSTFSGYAWSLWVDCGITWSTVGQGAMIHISNNGTGNVGSIFEIYGGANYLFRFRQVESGARGWYTTGTCSGSAGYLRVLIGPGAGTAYYVPLYTTVS